MKLRCYHVEPIDFWAAAMTLKGLIGSLDHYELEPERLARTIHSLAALEALARRGFRLVGWQGDVAFGPYYFALPSRDQLELGYMLKQAHGGSTFIASPHLLAWLDEFLQAAPVVVDDGGTPDLG